MSSNENNLSENSKSSTTLESRQRSIASSMARIVKSMVNKELQHRCKELLEMEDIEETEARILFILEQIDKEREEKEKLKNENKKRRKIKKKLDQEN